MAAARVGLGMGQGSEARWGAALFRCGLLLLSAPAFASPPGATSVEMSGASEATGADEAPVVAEEASVGAEDPAVTEEALAEEPADPDLPAWAAAGSGFYGEGSERVLRGVAMATGHRFLMDARKQARPQAVQELERQVRRLFSGLTVAYGKTAHDARDGAVVGEIAGLADAFVAYQHRLLDEIDGEHTRWSGRPDDAYWALSELELEALRRWIEHHAEVGPWTRTWLLEHLAPVFDASARPL